MVLNIKDMFINVDMLKSGQQFTHNKYNREKSKKNIKLIEKKLCTSQGFKDAFDSYKSFKFKN